MGRSVLLIVSALTFVLTNAALAVTGWIDAFNASWNQIAAEKRGLFVMDLLIRFFQDAMGCADGRLMINLTTAVAAVGAVAVCFEGSRRRNNDSFLLRMGPCIFWFIAQFVGIGMAVPLYFYFFLDAENSNNINNSKSKKITPVGLFCIISNALGIVGSGYGLYQLSETPSDTQLLTVTLLWPCFLPLFGMFIDVMLVPSGSSLPSSSALSQYYNRIFQESLYYLLIVIAVVVHLSFVNSLPSVYAMIMTMQPPSGFLAFDWLGVVLGCYIFLDQDTRMKAQLRSVRWWIVMIVLGPAAHLALLFLWRDRIIDQLNHPKSKK